MDSEVSGFGDANAYVSSDLPNKKSKKSGGFQSMGLSFPILKGIKKRGYNIPTPIQRKTIPLILEGRDVVAMARTGSGKTACFLIPLFEKLKTRTVKSGARALILSPTRELALQTLKFIKELGRFTDLRAAVILGGDSMESQFDVIHGNPDIIVATPGRFMHICIEMELKLSSVEYVVFDEADRLFEMGFGEQLREIVNRLPESRQTLLFSATLPKVLVEFAKAGLSDPVLIRLDVETKLPEQLKLAFLSCHSDEKPAALLCLLKHVIDHSSQTAIFAATKHHVEYLHMLLEKNGFSSTLIYSNLDPSARKINAAKFQTGKVSILIVTDIAARGIDIPSLDNVINYNFPAKSKLFLHRVGRCARAGRSGQAFSLVSGDEYAYLLDLHLFLGRPLKFRDDQKSDFPDGIIGCIPRTLLEEEHSLLLSWHERNTDLVNMRKVCNNAYKQYLRSRPGASVDSIRRYREQNLDNLDIHPIFTTNEDSEKLEILQKMKTYKPQGTIFELMQSASSVGYKAMKSARNKHRSSIANYSKKNSGSENLNSDEDKIKERVSLPESNEEDIVSAFTTIVLPKKFSITAAIKSKKKKLNINIDKEHFIPYSAPDHHTEQGLAVNNFNQEASKMELDLTADSEEAFRMQKKLTKWDSKKKKMVAVNQDGKSKKIRTESGVWVPASFKSNRYDQWKERMKILNEAQESNSADESESEDEQQHNKKKTAQLKQKVLQTPNTHWGRHNLKMKMKSKVMELRKPEQILKERLLKERKKKKERRRKKLKAIRSARSRK